MLNQLTLGLALKICPEFHFRITFSHFGFQKGKEKKKRKEYLMNSSLNIVRAKEKKGSKDRGVTPGFREQGRDCPKRK